MTWKVKMDGRMGGNVQGYFHMVGGGGLIKPDGLRDELSLDIMDYMKL